MGKFGGGLKYPLPRPFLHYFCCSQTLFDETEQRLFSSVFIVFDFGSCPTCLVACEKGGNGNGVDAR